jgi:hypothetical protein
MSFHETFRKSFFFSSQTFCENENSISQKFSRKDKSEKFSFQP